MMVLRRLPIARMPRAPGIPNPDHSALGGPFLGDVVGTHAFAPHIVVANERMKCAAHARCTSCVASGARPSRSWTTHIRSSPRTTRCTTRIFGPSLSGKACAAAFTTRGLWTTTGAFWVCSLLLLFGPHPPGLRCRQDLHTVPQGPDVSVSVWQCILNPRVCPPHRLRGLAAVPRPRLSHHFISPLPTKVLPPHPLHMPPPPPRLPGTYIPQERTWANGHVLQKTWHWAPRAVIRLSRGKKNFVYLKRTSHFGLSIRNFIFPRVLAGVSGEATPPPPPSLSK